MSYPKLPKNRLIVNGTDLSATFNMILVDGYTLSPPEPKTYTVDIPGGNGVLDLTETLLGDVAFQNRKQDFTFYIINVADFEKHKTKISNFLHGRSYDYKMTMDPDYTYHGRFKVTSYTHNMYQVGKVGVINVSVDANPFKMKDPFVVKVDAVGGTIVKFPSGRMRVRPVIETDGLTKVIHNNKLIIVQKGTWTLNDVIFEEGENEVYFCSYDIRNLTWGDLKKNTVTWGDFKQSRLFEWYKSNGDGTFVTKVWSDLSTKKWSDVSSTTWDDHIYKSEDVSTIDNVYIKYDWGDL